jgi:hypothetical protein
MVRASGPVGVEGASKQDDCEANGELLIGAVDGCLNARLTWTDFIGMLGLKTLDFAGVGVGGIAAD